MNKPIINQSSLQLIVFLLLIGQVWTNTIPYCDWLLDADTELIELVGSEDSESEEEDKKEKDEKLEAAILYLGYKANIFSFNILHSEYYFSLYHPENTTPPPELKPNFRQGSFTYQHV